MLSTLGPNWWQQCYSKLSDTKLPRSALIKETTSQVCPIICFWQKQAGRGAWLGNHTTIVFWSKFRRSFLFHISFTSCHCLLQSAHAGATPLIISQNKKSKIDAWSKHTDKERLLIFKHNSMKVVSHKKIPWEMELAPRYKLLALLTMLRLVTHTIAFHCLNISKYAYIYC